MRFHVLTPPHNICNLDYVACAYQMKALKFARMMTRRGHEVILYGVEGMDTEATEEVVTVTRALYDSVYGDHDFHSKFFKYDLNDAVYQEYFKNTIEEIGKRKQANDFLLPFWGVGNKAICDAHPDLITVEPGIGYAGGHWARWKVWESYAIYHAYYGLKAVGNCMQDHYDVVIPNYMDPQDFDFVEDKSPYVLFMGRIYDGKGLNIAIQATERAGKRLVVAGQGGEEYFKNGIPAHVDYVGYADRETRRYMMANAECTVVASQYLEPFGGVMVESLMSGTPVITSDWGAMSENNIHGITGYRCRNMEQYVWAINNSHRISPKICREYALNNFALEAIAPKYEEFFQQILDVYTGSGWYAEHGITQIHLPNRHIPNHDNSIDFDSIVDEERPQAERLANWIKQNLNPKKVLDIGCGPGIYTEELNRLHVRTTGLDPDRRTQGKNLQYYDLLLPAEQQADTVICLEVLEHIDPRDEQLALEHLVSHIRSFGTLIFTAARPGQGGTGHINCQPREHWIQALQAEGLTYSEELTTQLRDYMRSGAHMGWFTNNVIVMRK